MTHTFSRLFKDIALLTKVAPTFGFDPIPKPSVKIPFPIQGHQVAPSLLYAIVFVPDPAVIQRLSFHATSLPLVENTDVPRPVHDAPKSIEVAIVLVPSPTATVIRPFQNTELALVEKGCDEDAVHVPKGSAANIIKSLVVDFPTITHCVPIHCTSFTAVSSGLPSPVHETPSAEYANVFADPTPPANHTEPFHCTHCPDTSNTLVPSPVHTNPSTLVAKVLPPSPAAIHRAPFQIT